MKRLRQRLKQLRKARGFSQEELAEKVDLGYKYYQALESGRTGNPTVDTLEKTAKAFSVDVIDLLQINGESAVGDAAQAKYPAKPKKGRKKK